MADEMPLPTLNEVALAEASDDVPFEDFFANQNARDRGKVVAQATPPPAEPAPEEPDRDEPPAPEPPKPAAKPARHDPRARVQEAIAQRHDEARRREAAERERDELRTRIAALEQRMAPPQPPQPPQSSYTQPLPPAATDEPEPRWESYAQDPNPLAFLIAKTQYDTRQQIRAYAQQQQQVAVEQQNRIAATQVKQGLDAQWRRYATEHPDQPDVREQLDPEVGSLRYHGFKPDGSLDAGSQLGNWIAVSGLAPDILLYLSQHKDEFRELVRLEPPEGQSLTVESKANSALQGIYFGQMLERVKSNGNGHRQAVSRAKPPIRRPAPAATPGVSADNRDDNDLSEDALLRHIREGNAAEGRHRYFRRLR